MTPRTLNYFDPELRYDHFSDVNESIFKKNKNGEHWLRSHGKTLIVSSL